MCLLAFESILRVLACFLCAQAIEEDGLQSNSKEVGTHMLLELAKLRDKFEIVGDVRGKGLMIGLEMVKNKVRNTLPRSCMYTQ